MSKINWKEKSAKEIKNLVRGLNPIMGAYTYLDDKKLKFWKVQVITEKELLEDFCNQVNNCHTLEDIQNLIHPKYNCKLFMENILIR